MLNSSVLECKLSENSPLKTNPTTRPSANRTCTETFASHWGFLLFWKPRCLMASIRRAQSALHRTWKNQMQITQWIYGGWQAHTCRQQDGLRLEELNQNCESNSNGSHRPTPMRTTDHTSCTEGTSQTQRSSGEPPTPYSIGPHLPPPRLR